MSKEIFRDSFEYSRTYYKIGWHDGSLDFTTDKFSIEGQRVNFDGKWVILSSPRREIDELNKYSSVITSLALSSKTHIFDKLSKRLHEVDFYTGSFSLGGLENGHINEMMKKIAFASFILKEKKALGETVVETYVDTRKISTQDREALERKTYTLFSIFTVYQFMGKKHVGSESIYTIGDASKIDNKEIEISIEKALHKAFWSTRSEPLGVSDRGQRTIVLSQASASFFLHEISHGLNSLYRDDFVPGKKIGSTELTIRDDPLMINSPSSRVFDDEGVKAMRKTLMEKGEIVELLGTLFNDDDKSRPGNAYGLPYPPEPFHTNLYLEKGDWSDKEIIEETKTGFYIDGVLHSYIYDKVITLHPESVWKIVKGEIREPTWIREIKIPIGSGLESIDAISKTIKMRCGWERGDLVCEHSPMIRLTGYIY